MPKSVSSLFTIFIIFFICIDYFFYNFKVLSTVMKQGEDNTSTTYYATSSLTYLLAMVCSNMALQWVAYPTQVRKTVKFLIAQVSLT